MDAVLQILGAAAILGAGVLTVRVWLRSRRPGDAAPGRFIGPVREVEKKIRSGEAGGAPPLPIQKPELVPLDRAFAIVAPGDRFNALLDHYVYGTAWYERWDSLSDAEKKLLSVWEIVTEVNNGGFRQYFFNSSGDHAQTARKALAEVGAPRTAELFERALSVFPRSEPSKDREERWRQMDAWTDADGNALGELDGAFYDLPEDHASLLGEFALAHRGDFVPS